MTDMRQLADFLNVSIGTVSRALNNKPDIKPATKKRILDAAEQLGYVPNQSGRTLRKGKSNVVGFIYDSCTSDCLEKNGEILLMAASIQDVLLSRELELMILPRPDGIDLERFVTYIVQRQFVDGLIVATVEKDKEMVSVDVLQTLPMVRWSENETLTDEDSASRQIQFKTSGKLLAELLIARFTHLNNQNIHAKAAKVVPFEKNLRINAADVDIRMESLFHY